MFKRVGVMVLIILFISVFSYACETVTIFNADGTMTICMVCEGMVSCY